MSCELKSRSRRRASAAIASKSVGAETPAIEGILRSAKTRGDALLSARGVSTGPRLTDFEMTLHAGEIVGLGGLLGAGRTEAARALFGVDALTAGTVAPAAAAPAEAIGQGVGFLTEDRKVEGIVPDMSVRENMTMAILPRLTRAGQIDRAREREIVAHFIDALQIKTSGMEQPIRELSGGNQQKVLLARWLALDPKILILDEPTRGVDVGAKREIQAIIRDSVAKGVGVVLISSEFEELVEGADRIIVLNEGRIIAELHNPGITEDRLVRALAETTGDAA